LPHLVTVFGGREEVTPRSKVLGDGTIRGEEALGLSGGLKPLHAPLPLARRLMGILRPIVQIAVLAMFDARQDLPLGRAIAFEFVRDDRRGQPIVRKWAIVAE